MWITAKKTTAYAIAPVAGLCIGIATPIISGFHPLTLSILVFSLIFGFMGGVVSLFLSAAEIDFQPKRSDRELVKEYTVTSNRKRTAEKDKPVIDTLKLELTQLELI